MGSGTKSKGGIDMGSPGYNEDDWEAYRWCVRNNIAIGPKAYTEKTWKIDIINEGRTNTSPGTFGKNEIWQEIFKYCKYYYDKHRK